MFLEPKQYEHIVEILNGKIQPKQLLIELQDWARKRLEIEIYEFVCDYAITGKLRLKIILWDTDEYRKMFLSSGFDVNKQKLIAEKFAELAKTHNVYKEYWDSKDIFVCYDTIADEIKKHILENNRAKIMKIKHHDIWKVEIIFESIHIFYQTDEQIKAHENDGLSKKIGEKCWNIIKKEDVFHAFNKGINCVFTSRQTLNEKYKGSMFYYTR